MISSSTTPLLVVDSIWREPRNEGFVHAQIRLGGHPLQVVLNFASAATAVIPGFVEYVNMPWMLELHLPSRLAVLRLMKLYHAGTQFDLPADLSEDLARSSPPSPFRPGPEEDACREQEAASIHLELTELRRTGTYPYALRGVIRIDGEPVDIEIELYAGPGRVPVTRWMRSSRKLAALEKDAILTRLHRELESASS